LADANQAAPDPGVERALRDVTEWMARGFFAEARERAASALKSYPDSDELKSLVRELDQKLQYSGKSNVD